MKKHGMYGTPTYSSWAAMLGRCTGRTSRREYYVDKGISVCERWKQFANFLADMGVRPNGMTLDRIDGARNYEPGNCRWATGQQQAENRSCAVILTIGNESRTVRDWARVTGVNEGTIRSRIRRGWPTHELLDPRDFHFRSGNHS